MVSPFDQAVAVDAPPDASRHRHSTRMSAPTWRSAPSGGWLTALAYAVVVVPFAYALVRLATAPTARLTLADDLSLIDLHVRRALAWRQQLGVFDHNNWNHPGPTYFYLVSLVYRVLGSNARSLFVGATLLNALAAVGCVAVVRRRTTPARALWAAVWVGVLAAVLAAAGTSATTYSESVLGALVSPWNPTVVLFPLLLLILLCAGTIDRSGASLVGSLLVGSYVVQTDISTLPLAAVVIVVAGAVWLVTFYRDRAEPPSTGPVARRRARVLVVVGLAALALMWLPPIVQQVTNDPGNLTLLYRFFTAGHPGQTLTASLWAVAAAFAVLVAGPGEVMGSILGGTPMHAAWAVAVCVVTVALGAAVVVAGARRRSRFAVGMGALTLVGCVAAVVAVLHVVGFVFGYLALWAVVLPVASLIGAGTVPVPAWVGQGRTGSGLRLAMCAVAVAVGVVTCVRVAAIPPLSRAGDPHVGQLVDLVTPRLPAGGLVAVGDAGAGTVRTELLDTEEFIGLVDQLDRDGYRPEVSPFWKAEFGPGYESVGAEPRMVGLSTWTTASPGLPGYVGRVGDMAVTVTGASGRPAPPTR
ncbi:MAG: hypothetical protein ABSF84_16515 [Acidimicrobiales bacterium]